MKSFRHAYRDFERWVLPGAGIVASALAAVLLADALTFSRTRAIVFVYLAVALAAAASRGLLGLAQLLAATVPWLVVFGTRLPRLTETLAAATLAGLVYLVAVPQVRTRHSFLLRLGIVCFYGPVLLSLARQGDSDQFIQAAKYAVFPTIVLAVTEATNDRGLASLASFAFVSGIVAVGTNLALGLAGVSAFSSYGAGEIVGLAGAHDLSLLAGCLTAASLAATASLKWWPATAIGAIATVATGVRSTLPGLAAVAFARMVAAGARIRTIVLVSLAVAAVFLSGAAAVVEARYRAGESMGEFESFNALGSGRGEIYSTAVVSWARILADRLVRRPGSEGDSTARGGEAWRPIRWPQRLSRGRCSARDYWARRFDPHLVGADLQRSIEGATYPNSVFRSLQRCTRVWRTFGARRAPHSSHTRRRRTSASRTADPLRLLSEPRPEAGLLSPK